MQQQELARAAGVTPETLRGLEQCTRKPTWATITAVLKALGTTPELLMQGEAPVPGSDPRTRDLKDEDYRVAQAYHHSESPVRKWTQRVLSGDIDPASLQLAEQINRLTEADRDIVIAHLEISRQLTEPLAPK